MPLSRSGGPALTSPSSQHAGAAAEDEADARRWGASGGGPRQTLQSTPLKAAKPSTCEDQFIL